MKDNIILIGMPGVGKSTIGVILAKVLGYDFIDSDLVIQKQMGMRLKELIRLHGIDGFNEIENNINASIEATNSIIATGGSAVYGADAMAHFKEIGTIVYLKLSLRQLKYRLGDLDERGVVHRPDQTLKDLYQERCMLYEKYADITITLDGETIEEALSDVLNALGKSETKGDA